MNIGAQDCIFIDDNEVEISNVMKVIPEIKGFHFNAYFLHVCLLSCCLDYQKTASILSVTPQNQMLNF